MPIDDVTEDYNEHREKFNEENKYNAVGWQDARYKFDRKYDPYNSYYATKTHKDKYNIHNTENVIMDIPYWDSKENDAYYSLSRWIRFKLLINEKFSNLKKLPVEFYVFNLLFLLMILFYANKKSRQIIS